MGMGSSLIHIIASILGIFSYLWMCFNVIIMIKLKVIEKKTSLDWLIKFHTSTSVIALSLGFIHGLVLYLTGEFPGSQLITGIIGFQHNQVRRAHRSDVRVGSKAEVQRGPRNVRCWG